MIFTIHNRHRQAGWLPVDFEALSIKDAQRITQAWADRLNFGPLDHEWSSAGEGCAVFFWRDGDRQRFCTLINTETDNG